jgi:hypothetical protein
MCWWTRALILTDAGKCEGMTLRLPQRAEYITSVSRGRGGRVVECGGLENRYRGNPIGGSNPPLSATPYFDPQKCPMVHWWST